MSEEWFIEYNDTDHHSRSVGLAIRFTKRLVQDASEFQKIDILETPEFGKVLLLDNYVMITEKDEFIYHDMIAHVPACLLTTHAHSPKSALVIGGGDGGSVRELLKHPSLEKIILCEIDGKVVDYCKTYFPAVSGQLDNPRVEVIIGDGIRYIREHENSFDIICVDSTDPVGPAVGLFNRSFYESVYRALTPHGIMSAQSESAFFRLEFIQAIQEILHDLFPYAALYQAPIPTYPGGTWSFSLASKKIDPLSCNENSFIEKNTFQSTHYDARVHQASFILPVWLREKLKNAVDDPSPIG